jgi:hypothetical protein
VPSSPQVSVLLPFRDAAATLDAALESMLEEQRVPLEVLAIDDGSSDASMAIAQRWAGRDPRVRCGTARGSGIAAALNTAAAMARGPVLARMDADDISLPGRFPRQLELLETNVSLGAVGTQVAAFSASPVGEGLLRYVRWQNELVRPEDHDRNLFVESPLCHPSTAIRREAFEAVGGYRDGPFAEDYDLWLRLRARGYRLAKVPEVLLRWRQHPCQATFRDPRYQPGCFRALKAEHLAPVLRALERPVVVWGAGPTGKRMARALEAHGVHACRFIDIDPRKVGRTARGQPIVDPSHLVRGAHTVVVAVGALGARQEIRDHLTARGFVEGQDFICTA